MRRPSSTSASDRLSLLLAFFTLALAASLGLDRVAFSRRNWLHTVELGRWAEPQWAKRAELLRHRASKPAVLMVGDSSLGYGIKPSLLAASSFTLSRPGLNCRELDQMSDRIDSLCQPPPRLIVVGLIWFEFLPFKPELGFIEGDRPTAREILEGFYQDPNLIQTSVFPGSRVARYWVDNRLETLDERRRLFGIRIDGDGFGVSESRSEGATPSMPPQMKQTVPGWFTQESLQPLQRFRQRWESRGVPVVFVSMPLHPAFRSVLLAKAGEDQRHLREALGRVFGDRFLDYEDAVSEISAFRDATHLNAEGAHWFTTRLREDKVLRGLLPTPG